MKITRVETFKFWVDWCNWMFVRISTDEGLVGVGETPGVEVGRTGTGAADVRHRCRRLHRRVLRQALLRGAGQRRVDVRQRPRHHVVRHPQLDVAVVSRRRGRQLDQADGLAEGEPKYDQLEERLSAAPVISVPTITLEGDANGAPHPDPATYAKKFSGKYKHRLITGGIGHNLPQEAPRAFAVAIVEVDEK